MHQRAQGMGDGVVSLPPFWSETADGTGATLLIYAIRGGLAQFAVAVLGVACFVAGASGAFWLLTEGELTIGGMIFIVLVPGGAIAFGVYCLNIAWWARTEYAFTNQQLTARSYSIWGNTTRQVSRSSIRAINQNYAPPESGSAASSPGTWATILDLADEHGADGQLVFEGMGSAAEARWLGAWVSRWAGIPLKRGFGAAFVEADEKELPSLDD